MTVEVTVEAPPQTKTKLTLSGKALFEATPDQRDALITLGLRYNGVSEVRAFPGAALFLPDGYIGFHFVRDEEIVLVGGVDAEGRIST